MHYADEIMTQSMSEADFHKTNATQRTQRKQWERKFHKFRTDNTIWYF